MNALAPRDLSLAIGIAVLGGAGLYLLLPHHHGALKPRLAHLVGGALAALAVLMLLLLTTPPAAPGTFLQGLFFYAFAITGIAAGILMITTRNPIYSALWFAAVVLSTTGLFLLAEAQFLAAGTVIVYAGAIIVTFLFVIMLAQAGGQAPYDRASRMPFRSTLTGFLLYFGLLYALLFVRAPFGRAADPDEPRLVRPLVAGEFRAPRDVVEVRDRALTATVRLPRRADPKGPPPPHVAGLGGTLFTDHLISAEVAGVILFVALVGALAIATPKAPVRPGRPRPDGVA